MEKSFFHLVAVFLLLNITSTEQNEKKLSFIAVGDIGGLPYHPYCTSTQKSIASEMGKLAKKSNAKFVIGLGDNFYYNGIKKVTDPRFQQTFESIYTHPSLKHPNCRWYMIAGNHDHHGNVSAQIAYTKLSERWHFPYYYYSRIEKIPGTDMTVHVVMIDTTLLCCVGKRKNDEPLAKVQMAWIDETLKNSTADYLIVAGHHPILSVGVHGPTSHVRMKKIQTMLEKYNVTAYISGHDHNIQHLKEKRSKVHYVIAGNGNFVSPGKQHIHSVPKGSLKYFFGNTGGFTLGEVTPMKFKLKFLNEKGYPLYTIYARPRRNIADGASMLNDFFKMQGQLDPT